MKRAALAFLFCGAALAGSLQPGTSGAIGRGSFGDSVSTASQRSAMVSITITSPTTDPALGESPQIVSGTTSGGPSSVTWATSPESGSGSCTTGAGTFSCSVTANNATQTVTVSANAGAATDTIVIAFPILDQRLVAPTFPTDSLTVNGTNPTIVASCNASTISGTNWVCDTGGTLAEASAGASPTTSTTSPFLTTTTNVTYVGSGKVHTAALASTADITTEDFFVEYFGYSPVLGEVITHDSSTALATTGYYFGLTSTASRLIISDGANTQTFTASGYPGGWTHVFCYVDRSANGNCCVNGVCGTSASAAAVGSITSTSKLTIGGFPTFSYNVGASQVRVWTCSGCINTEAEVQAIAKARSDAIESLEPPINVGSGIATTSRTNGPGYTTVCDAAGINCQLYPVSTNFLRSERRKEVAGGEVLTGFRVEPTVTNRVLQSSVLGTTWTKSVAGLTIGTNSAQAADGTTTADGIRSDATTSEFGVDQAVTLAAVTTTFSVYADAGQKTFAYLYDNTVANTAAWFNLSNCTVGTVQASATAAVDSNAWINGICRISITFTGTVASHSLRMRCASADNTLTYAGDNDGTDDCTFSKAQVEDYAVATSPIDTTTGSVARSVDVYTYASASNATTSGEMRVDFLCPAYDVATALTFESARVDATNYMIVGAAASGDRPFATAFAGGGTAEYAITSATGDVGDGEGHSMTLAYQTDDVQLFYDGTIVGSDLEAAMLSSLASGAVGVGYAASGGVNTPCIVQRVRNYATPVSDGLVARIGVIGDSITAVGENSTTKYWELASVVVGPTYGHRSEADTGDTSAQALSAQWTGVLAALPYQILVIDIGTNDAAASTPSATTMANINQMANEAIAAGWLVITTDLAPRGSSAGWSAPKQAILDATNASLLAAADDVTRWHVVWYDSLCSVGTDNFDPTLNVGDGIHPNQAGQNVMEIAYEAVLLDVLAAL